MRFAARLVAAAAATATAAVAQGNSVCFSAPYDPATCLTWRSDAKNITFTAVWPAIPGAPTSQVGWGGWGIASLTCGSMYPSSVWMAIRGPGGVVLEDRAAVAHVVPQCQKQQLSHVIESRVDRNGTIVITWTRPLVAPKSSGQPSIVPGNVTIIGAVFFGALDLRPCEATGIPGHNSIVSSTVELLPSAGRGAAAAEAAGALAPALAAPAAGLTATFLVCSSAFTNLAHLSPAGPATYYGKSSPIALLPGISAVDVAGRKLYSLLMSPNGASYELVSINVDSGVRGATCATAYPVPSNYALQNLNIAFDSNNGTVLVAGCTDLECAGYVLVSRIDPATCTATPVVKFATDPPLNQNQQAATGFDPATNTLVVSATQASKKGVVGLVLVSINVLTGTVLHVLPEAGANATIVSLANAGPGLFVGVASLPDYTLAFATYDSVRNKVSVAPVLPSYVAPLPGLGAYVHGDSGDIYYFLTEDGSIGGAVRIVGVFAANGTLASSGTIPGDASQAPSSLFYL